MSKREPFDLKKRIGEVEEERGAASVETFVKALEDIDDFDPVESNMNKAYLEQTFKLDNNEYAPFMFTKGMPLEQKADGDRYEQGIVPKERKERYYRDPVRLGSALTESEDNFKRGGRRPFIGVPNTYTVGLQGMETWRGIMSKAPDPTGVENAAEMIDVYAMEQLRDVPFTAWPNEPGGDGPQEVSEITAAGSDAPTALKKTLNQLETDLKNASKEAESEADYDGPWYDIDRLFVEVDSVDSWGPYVSQFLLHEVNLWALPAEQRYLRYERGDDYNDTVEDWLNTLEGKDKTWAEHNPNTPSESEDNPRGYIATPRHLATIVNAEPPYQEYLIAALRLIGTVDFDQRLKYATPDNDGDGDIDIDVFDYIDGGPVGLFELLARVSRHALLAAFFQKYYVHFRCRPETYAGRVRAQRENQTDFDIAELLPDLLLNSEILRDRTGDENLLSTAYEEGSPVHPAYPSGHSVIAGACGTVLKTWFKNEDWPEDLPYYVPTHDDNTFGTGLRDLKKDEHSDGVPDGHNGISQEIDKLVSNIGLARMFAGVHYYSDHYAGVRLGEQIAVGVMADIFNRAERAMEDRPKFTRYLDYDEELPVTKDTLDKLRGKANNRRDEQQAS